MVNYDFYISEYQGGSIQQEEWGIYARQAEAQLAWYKRIYTVTVPDNQPNAEKMAICALAEALHNVDLIANGEGGLQSASIGSVSTSYGNAAAAVDMSAKGQAKELYRLASLYLDIYRGVC